MTERAFDDGHAHAELAHKTARGALASILGQGGNFVLRIASMTVMARLITPEHFGLFGMVAAVVGLLSLIRDAGLSVATVQQDVVSHELLSSMFWINVLVGVVLAGVTALGAPAVAAFFGDPRLVGITLAMAASFVSYGAAAQHRALLQRRMQFVALTVTDVLSLMASIAVGIAMAWAGLGYWALVGMAVSQPLVNAVALWVAAGWTPGRYRRAAGIGHMLHYGGVVSLNSIVVYVAYNADKLLVGRFLGAEALGIYGRAYQLISIPTDNLHSTLNWVMFPALARVQNDPHRLRNFFLKSFGIFLAIVTPITVCCGLFAEEIVRILLGPQWSSTPPIFRLLAPTILALAVMNPMGQLMQATGHAIRSLKLAFLIAPVTIAGVALGLPYGPEGVAAGFSTAMGLLVAPLVYWARKGTLITVGDIARTTAAPCLATLVGAAASWGAVQAIGSADVVIRLAVGCTALFVIHFVVLAYGLGQKAVFKELFGKLVVPKPRPATLNPLHNPPRGTGSND